MTTLQRLQLRASELRSKLNDLSGLETLTAEQRAELDAATSEYQTVEAQLRAAILAESEPPAPDTPEAREDAELHAAFDLARVFEAIVEHRAVDGAERDLQQRYELAANAIPIAALAEDRVEHRVETVEERAIATITGDVGARQQPITPYVFPSGASAFIGVRQPTVPVGEAVYPVLTNAPDVHAPGVGDAAAESTAAFSTTTITPKRLQASVRHTREDAAKFAGMGAALRENLRDALSDGLDKQILMGTDGLYGTALNDAAAPDLTPASGQTSWAQYKNGIVSFVDGRYSSAMAGVRVLVGVETYQHAAAQYRDQTDPEDGLDMMRRLSGGLRVSVHVPDPSSDEQKVIYQRGPLASGAVAPIWEGVTLIPDEITAADEGEIILTAVMLYGFKVLRSDQYRRSAVKVSGA